MSTSTKIEWTQATWNPVTGCTEVSPGCDNCYAKTFAERWRGTPGHHFEQGFDVVLRPERLDQPLKWRKPRRIFVNSMSDIFHDSIPDEHIGKVFAVMALTKRHTFQLLTKRHGRMRSLLNERAFADSVQAIAVPLAREHGLNTEWAERATDPRLWPLRNVWLGVSVEDQKWADIRIPALLETPAAVRWLSCEPLLGPVEAKAHWLRPTFPGPRVDWLVAGGESGRGARPMHPDWARSLRDQCTEAGVPFFFKQWGEWQDGSHDPRHQHGPDHVILHDGRHVPFEDYAESDLTKGPATLRHGACVIARVGKKSAGRLLDGHTWDQYPAGAR